ncbi:MAG TPA: hypothetical protein VL201_04435 [Patescibacteria group bacterium]|jgi:hypothetical protein|nr:hypothetical protein [Patescibacteria group bacterium]
MNYFIKNSLIFALLMDCTIGSTFSMYFLRKQASRGTLKSNPTQVSQKPSYTSLLKDSKKQIHIFASKNGEKELSKESHQKVYSASLKHEFPTAPFYNDAYKSTECETKAIVQELAAAAPDVEVQWIPRTLYELFVIQHYHNVLVTPHGYAGYLENSDLRPLFDINNHQYNKELHKKINDNIISFLHERPRQKDATDHDYFIELAAQLLNNFPIEIKAKEKLIFNAITYEIEIHQKNPESFILYRGGPLHQRDFNTQLNYALNPTEKFLPKYISLSFGLGFFAAYFTDIEACTAQICSAIPQAYVLPIHKGKLCNNTSTFFVPPLAPLPNFFSKGEAFHARTKIPLTYLEQKTVSLYDGWCTNEAPLPKNLIIENDNFLTPWITRNAIYKNLYRYLIDKAHPLNEETTDGIEKIKKRLPEE